MVSNNSINNTVADNDFSVNRATAGTSVVSSSEHSDNTNAASHAILEAKTGGASGGDAAVHLQVTGATEYSVGIDNTTTTDLLKITTGATPSAGTTLLTVGNNGVKDFVGFFDATSGPAGIGNATVSIVDETIGGQTSLQIQNSDDTNTSSNAALNLRVGGTSAGDPFVLFYDRNGNTAAWSVGFDNSDADAFKIGPNQTPSLGTSSIEIATGGDITFNEAYQFPTADGNNGDVLTTDGAGNVDWEAPSGGSGLIEQYVYTSSSSRITITGTIPQDDTIPQNTEGTEVITLSITPTSATNLLIIEFNGFMDCPANSANNIALFQDSTANALAAFNFISESGAGTWGNASLSHTMVAGTTSSTTFKIRASNAGGSTGYFNGNSGGRSYGGKASLSFRIYEVTV